MEEKSQDTVQGVALLVIDVQKALFEKSRPVYLAPELLRNIGLLIDRAHDLGIPVIFFQHVNTSFLAEGSEGWQFHPALTPGAADLILQKRHGSAFQETPLQDELQARGINRLVVTGLVTNGCVKAACQDAKKRGYRVILVKDGHSTYQERAASLIDEWNQKLGEEGVEIVPAERIDFGAG